MISETFVIDIIKFVVHNISFNGQIGIRLSNDIMHKVIKYSSMSDSELIFNEIDNIFMSILD